MKCKVCNKPIKENTEGNKKFCPGHDTLTLERSGYVIDDYDNPQYRD